MLPRTNKYLPKPENFPISPRMARYALKNVNSVDSLQSSESTPALHNFDHYREGPIEHQNEKKLKKWSISRVFSSTFKKFKLLLKLVLSRKFNISEIALILRPVIYMYMLLK